MCEQLYVPKKLDGAPVIYDTQGDISLAQATNVAATNTKLVVKFAWQ